jgi:hypothetical protein
MNCLRVNLRWRVGIAVCIYVCMYVYANQICAYGWVSGGCGGCGFGDTQACMHASIHPCMQAFVHSSIHSSVHAFIHSSEHAFIHPCIHPSIHSFIRACLHSSSCMLAVMYAFIHAFIHETMCLFACKHGTSSQALLCTVSLCMKNMCIYTCM